MNKPAHARRAVAAASLAILLAALSLGAAPGAAAPGSADTPSLEAQVDALFAKWNSLDTPGAAVAVIKDGIVVYRKGFGCAQLEYGVPITPSTVFHVASVSKQFTAMAITMLEAAGKLSADDNIRKYLPEMADFGVPITIRHLLNHTSGLRDQWDLLILSGWRMDDVITQAQILDRLRRQKELNFAPGSRYLYSNSGFTLLAEIVSRVSGKPFTDWTRETIFQPLGMTSTHFHLDHTEIVRDRAYSYDGDPEHGFHALPLNYANVGATSLFTTVEDMANWLRNFEDKRVGGPAVLDKMETKGVLNDGTEIGYARGLEIGVYKGLKTIGHSGGDAGFRSQVIYFPGERFGVAVFSNLGLVRSRNDGTADRRHLPRPADRRSRSRAPSKARRLRPPRPPLSRSRFRSRASRPTSAPIGSSPAWFESSSSTRTSSSMSGRATTSRSSSRSRRRGSRCWAPLATCSLISRAYRAASTTPSPSLRPTGQRSGPSGSSRSSRTRPSSGNTPGAIIRTSSTPATTSSFYRAHSGSRSGTTKKSWSRR